MRYAALSSATAAGISRLVYPLVILRTSLVLSHAWAEVLPKTIFGQKHNFGISLDAILLAEARHGQWYGVSSLYYYHKQAPDTPYLGKS